MFYKVKKKSKYTRIHNSSPYFNLIPIKSELTKKWSDVKLRGQFGNKGKAVPGAGRLLITQFNLFVDSVLFGTHYFSVYNIRKLLGRMRHYGIKFNIVVFDKYYSFSVILRLVGKYFFVNDAV